MAKVPQREDWQATLTGWREELDRFYVQLNSFEALNDVGEILRIISAVTARVSEIRTQVVRLENKALTSFRTKELDALLSECDRQFTIWSRLQSVMQFEFDTTRGT